ncbi:Small Conductance Mechanosensitive Ion Channel (MscS) Family [Phytophthora palmivora]|uniref:Small Conductance Mechanosensitive Ion Channel (MscS) Family n=1 Tax=Phytophthora palmivora TaxID=4796 RepID=A0A2P4YMP2_9STRA|nr:Small Conductance Mechanosensitive Ion Channel (MscS) Family [Phytophthora palmivora]
MSKLLLLLAVLYVDAVGADDGCDDDCSSVSCLPEWWRSTKAPQLVVAAVMVFFATFLPRVLVRLLIFVLTKLPFMHQCYLTFTSLLCSVAEDFRESCAGSTSYLISTSLVLLALKVSELTKFFCHLPTYIWGIFFLYWLYSLFNVVQSLAVRRFVGTNGDFSKKMVISESVKILRLTTMLIIALIIYSSALGDSATLKYSVLGVIGLAIALGFVPSFHNVVGGLFLAFNAQFKIDDFIRVGDAEGFVHRVSLRYTTVVSLDGTTLYVPNSFFLYKPMINFSQRPKRDVDLHVRVSRATPVETLRQALRRLESMLQSLHVGLTSHEENLSDLRHGEKWERLFFVAMEELYTIRVYSYTDELDARKYAMLKSEVWLAVTEIMEELGIRVLSNDDPDNPFAESPHFFKRSSSNTSSHADDSIGDPFTSEIGAVVGALPSSNGIKGPRTQL